MSGCKRRTRAFIIARFKNGPEFEALRDELAKLGIVLSHDWYAPMKSRQRGRQEAARARALVADIAGIGAADYVISMVPRGNDSHVEIGAAIALKKPIILVSSRGQNDLGYADHPLVIARPVPDGSVELARTICEIITWHRGEQL